MVVNTRCKSKRHAVAAKGAAATTDPAFPPIDDCSMNTTKTKRKLPLQTPTSANDSQPISSKKKKINGTTGNKTRTVVDAVNENIGSTNCTTEDQPLAVEHDSSAKPGGTKETCSSIDHHDNPVLNKEAADSQHLAVLEASTDIPKETNEVDTPIDHDCDHLTKDNEAATSEPDSIQTSVVVLQEATTTTTSVNKDDRKTVTLAGTTKAPKKKEKTRFSPFLSFPLGNELDDYQYPPVGTKVQGGRAAATAWQQLMYKTRTEKMQHVANSDDIRGTLLSTDDKENKKTTGKTSGSRYPSYACGRKCGGYMKLKFGEGKQPVGQVTKMQKCTCPFRDQPDVNDINYSADSIEDLVGDLILHINSTYNTFVVEACSNYKADGVRSNHSFCSFKTKDKRVFESKNKKSKEDGKWMLASISEVTVDSPLPTSDNQPTEVFDSGDCIICLDTIAAPQLLSFVDCGHQVCAQCRDGMCKTRPAKYDLFMHLDFSGDRSTEPVEESIDLILPNRMIVQNDCAVRCPLCKKPRDRLVDRHGNQQILPVPYGWFGNRTVYSAHDFREHNAVFELTVRKYQDLYDKAVYVLTKLPGEALIDESMSKEDIFARLKPALLYLYKKVWVEQKWLQDQTIPLSDVAPETTWFENCTIGADTMILIDNWFQNCCSRLAVPTGR